MSTRYFLCIYLQLSLRVFTLSFATATINSYTMEIGQPIQNYHFNMFALSVATATVSVDTIFFVHILTTIVSVCLY